MLGCRGGIVLDAAGGNSMRIAHDVIPDNIAMGREVATAVDGDGNTITLAEASGSTWTSRAATIPSAPLATEITFGSSNASLTLNGSGDAFTFTGTGDALTVNESTWLPARVQWPATTASPMAPRRSPIATSILRMARPSYKRSIHRVEFRSNTRSYSGANETAPSWTRLHSASPSQFEYFNPNSDGD